MRALMLLKTYQGGYNELWVAWLLFVSKFILFLIKNSKTGKIYYFFLKKWVSFFNTALLFFSLDNSEIVLYANVPKMFKFNPKISIQKYPIFCSWYNFFSANISDFTRISLLLKQKVWVPISLQKIKLY